ncbi:EAL and HDOD domain-containing protein [Paraburkholderia silvatlantica]|uniref:C-di-GMP-related signal transduction protein n=1 Tax=Paraburkholderia silvatlantica TaxID=321895 RepID=A0A2U1AE72_9BURK|nr:EAL domain-containing protein [Paraburkholderia silvatlantica]MBB2928235.1 c-di-GMP-related signal transduction protein [Paraburkholderia silvatlantica]PVY34718.1 c-di-GMP-related signal transduction protein [Paraburkholderia silvatlantica]PXW38933.1 c-di-GMP-related signal transduction protein [Paraburkholderia silvatlantica]PYE22401.1 c-di-GMP-related signal transduction protein [Paraburkholderia silvatlantica]TDQ89745.1 c-di-GMP-related signal transduction protein [Paraburkholderia silva
MSLNAADRPQMSGVAGSTQSPEHAGPPIDVYFARQPMLDREGLLCAFETLPRLVDRRESAAIGQEAEAAAKDEASGLTPKPSATSTALLKSFAAPVLRASLAGHPAWLDMTRDALFHDGLLRVSPERVMLELPVNIGADADLIARLVELHRRRYRFALDHVSKADESLAKLLPYVDAIKIDIREIAPTVLPKFASVMKAAGKLLVAMGVETQEDYQRAHGLGFDRFQGYFFAKPHGGARRSSAPRQALLNLLHLLAAEPTVAQLEAELKLNPVLVMHLMRLANSGSMNIGRKVTTLREAINATGTNAIARWTQLLLYADGRKIAAEDDPLLQLVATRARFMEIAVTQLAHAHLEEEDAAFLVGVFSFVEAVFGGPLESTLEVLTLAKPIRTAIVRREGALGRLLELSEALERADWARVDALCAELAPLDAAAAAAISLTAAEWAGTSGRDAEHEGLERIED